MPIQPRRIIVALGLSLLVPVLAAAQTPTEAQLAAQVSRQPQSVSPLLDLAKFYADRQMLQQAQTTLQRAVVVLNEQIRLQGVSAVTAPSPPPVAPAQSFGAIRVGANIKQPAQIKRVQPAYPDDAKVAGITGMVILEVLLDTGGHVKQATVLRHVSPSIDQAALDAVRQWAYTPTLLNGAPVEVVFTVTVNFSM